MCGMCWLVVAADEDVDDDGDSDGAHDSDDSDDSDEEDIQDDADADADADNGDVSSTCPKKHGLKASYPHVMTSLPFKRAPKS